MLLPQWGRGDRGEGEKRETKGEIIKNNNKDKRIKIINIKDKE